MSRFRAAGLAAWLVLCGSAQGASVGVLVSSPTGVPVKDSAVVIEPLVNSAVGHRAVASIVQEDREFLPYVTIVQTGTTVNFPNHDPIKHHVYSFSSAKTFEIKLNAGKSAQSIVFDKPGEVAIGCNVHDWMEAYVLVVDSPYFARTGNNGRATIANVPPGRYRLKLWHPRQISAPPVRELVVTAASAKVELTLDVAPRTVKPKPPTDADRY